jgi:hypothetical protein
MTRGAAALLMASLLVLSACGPLPANLVHAAATARVKITFDMSTLDADGLYGPPDGKRALGYEFCIPADPAAVSEVKSIDPTAEVHQGSKGRIGCTSDQYLVIGSTAQPHFRSTLVRLSALDYVARIDQSFGE